jgi:hypothetical protein
MDQFPAMLYRHPAASRAAVALQDGSYDTRIVGDQDAQDEAIADGWHQTPGDAKAAAEAPAKETEPVDELPPTRAELETEAAELGLKVDGRMGDKKLAALIAEKRAA